MARPVLVRMGFRRTREYFESRLKDKDLLLQAVKVWVGYERVLCVPCGGDRVTGFTHFFRTSAEANIVCRSLADSGGNFPDLRVDPILNAFDEEKFIVRWGKPEPRYRNYPDPWDFELAMANCLGYNDECMVSHHHRMHMFQYGTSVFDSVTINLSCGVSPEDLKLSDEQVAELNGYEPVKDARTAFLRKATEYVKSRTPELLEQVKTLEAAYGEAFRERLHYILEHPPQPRAVALANRRGFK